jgi:hypothetical protein
LPGFARQKHEIRNIAPIVDISGIFGYDIGIVGWTAQVTPLKGRNAVVPNGCSAVRWT